MSLIEFIIPTNGKRNDLLKCILSSLSSQTSPDWKAKVVIDNTHSESFYTEKLLLEFGDHRIKYTYSGMLHNDWGHTARDLGRMEANARYTIMTGDDNYYVPTFVDQLDRVINDNPGFVYWDMVHSSFDYQYFKCTPGNGQIDIGAFAVRTDLCKQVRLGRDYAADGQFVEDYKKMFPHEKMVKINKILYVHN